MRTITRLLCQLLIAGMVMLSPSTQAGMIGTDSVLTHATARADRDKVLDFVNRADVRKQMEALGLDPASARDRVSALTDDEVQRIAGKIDTMPAGASNSATAWELAGLIVLAVIVYVFWK